MRWFLRISSFEATLGIWDFCPSMDEWILFQISLAVGSKKKWGCSACWNGFALRLETARGISRKGWSL